MASTMQPSPSPSAGGAHNDLSTMAQREGSAPPILDSPTKGKRTWSSQWKTRKMEIMLAFEEPTSSRGARVLAYFLTLTILVNTTAIVVQSLPTYIDDADADYKFSVVEACCVAIFTVDYVTRFICCRKLIPFLFEPMNVVDIVAIVPFYVDVASTLAGAPSQDVATSTLRVLRLLRAFRLFRVSIYYNKVKVLAEALRNSSDIMLLMLNIFILFGVAASACMFFAERGEWDDGLGKWMRHDGFPSYFQSIPGGIYWVIVTMGTVGFGDHAPPYVTPVSIFGQLVSGITMVLGIVMISMPISIIGMNFTNSWQRMVRETEGLSVDAAPELDDAAPAARKARESVSCPVTPVMDRVEGGDQRPGFTSAPVSPFVVQSTVASATPPIVMSGRVPLPGGVNLSQTPTPLPAPSWTGAPETPKARFPMLSSTSSRAGGRLDSDWTDRDIEETFELGHVMATLLAMEAEVRATVDQIDAKHSEMQELVLQSQTIEAELGFIMLLQELLLESPAEKDNAGFEAIFDRALKTVRTRKHHKHSNKSALSKIGLGLKDGVLAGVVGAVGGAQQLVRSMSTLSTLSFTSPTTPRTTVDRTSSRPEGHTHTHSHGGSKPSSRSGSVRGAHHGKGSGGSRGGSRRNSADRHNPLGSGAGAGAGAGSDVAVPPAAAFGSGVPDGVDVATADALTTSVTQQAATAAAARSALF